MGTVTAMIADDMYTENYVEGEYSHKRDYYKDDAVCSAPHCKNQRRATPGLHYFCISGKLKERFCQLTGRSCPKRCIYVCEEHISLKDCYRTGGGLLRLNKTASFPLVQNASENISLGQKRSFKCCIVPDCGNSIVKSPEKELFPMPRGKVMRRKWCEAIRRDVASQKSLFYCCEDHFNIEEDTENYMIYKNMRLQKKKNYKLRLKKDVIPHKFPHRDDLKKRKHSDTDRNEDMPSSPAEQITFTETSVSKGGITYTYGPEEYNRDESYQESDPLIKKETIEEIEDITNTTTIKMEFEEETEVSRKLKSHDNDETFDPENCPKSEPQNGASDMTVEQFMRGCEIYLSPELAYFVKTQIRVPV